MNDPKTERSRQMLTHRLDALRIAIDKCNDRDADAPSIVRGLATSILCSADGIATTAVAQAATAVLRAPDDRIRKAACVLMRTMRHALARPNQPATILIIGGAPDVNTCFVERLKTVNRSVVCAWTGEEAREIIAREDVVFVILNLFLPDMDGRALLAELRESPSTATIPLLVVDEINAGDWIRHNGLLLGADGYVVMPIDMDVVTEQVRTLLRRAHHTVNAPRRDPLTGLLNRAAMSEAYLHARKACQDADEPLSLALLTITGDESISMMSPLWDEIMQQAGLLLSQSIRSTDILARWGANEFAILFTGTERACAFIAVEKVRKAIERDPIVISDGKNQSVRVCAGVSQLLKDDAFGTAMDRADKCLFAAQAAGGGVVADNSEMPPSPRRALLFHELRTARLLKQLLIKQGVEVITVEDLPGGLLSAPDMRRLHLVVIDSQVKGGGLNALAALRNVRAYDRVPVLMLLQHDSEAGLLKAIELGASDYLTSPFAPAVFVARVRRLLSMESTATTRTCCSCDVLIADDDATTLVKAASSLYQHGGFSVCLARGADDAIARFRAERPRVVIIDPWMKRGNVDAPVLDEILQDAGQNGTLVIATIREGCPAATVREIVGRVKGIIRKPFDLLSFAMEIEKILNVTVGTGHPCGAARQLNNELMRIMHVPQPRQEAVPV